jgi:hypothetical protein
MTLKKRLLILVIGLYSFNSYAQLYINEILASNITVNRDPLYNNYGDWIEIYNGGNIDIYLDNYYLSDDPNNPTRYQINGSNLMIRSGEYKVIWMNENRVQDDVIYTDFSLSGKGEFISLYDDDQSLIDSVSFEKQLGDVSFGRERDGSDQWGYFQTPTPNLKNEGLFFLSIDQVSDVNFSIRSGFFDAGTTIELSCIDQSAEIRYTLNGDIPADTSQLYVGAIAINSTSVLRARAFSNDKLSSPILTNTYFIGVDADIPVVSISTNAENFYNEEYGIYVRGTNGVDGKCSSVPVNWNQDWERNLNMEYFNVDKERVINQLVGTKIGGNCSRLSPLKSLAIFARSKYGDDSLDYRFFSDKPNESYKTIVLRNSGSDVLFGMFRDGFMQTLIKDRMDIDYQGYQPSLVFFNGAFWGILNTREKVNENYINNNYHLKDEEFDMLEDEGTVFHGESTHYNQLLEFVANNNLSLQENYDVVSEMMDVDEFINYYLSQIYFDNGDWPHRNIKYWREKKNDGKWRWILFDTDWGYGLKRTENLLSSAISSTRSPLFGSLLENQTFRNRFIQTTASHLNTTFLPERCIALVDSLSSLIEEYIPEMVSLWKKPGSVRSYYVHVDEVMPEFAIKRIGKMQRFIMEEFDISGMFKVSVSVNASEFGYVTINDVDIPSEFSGEYFGDIPIQLKAIAKPGYEFLGWDGDVNQIQNAIEISTATDIGLIANFKERGPYNIFINEFSSSNIDNIKDESDEFGDWIEIYNANDFEVNLGGLYLTDDLDDLFKYQIEENSQENTILAAKGYTLIWADDNSIKGAYHTNFKLSQKGEQLGLVQKIDGKAHIIDTLTYEEQYSNSSLSRYPDGSDNWVSIPATPSEANIYIPISGIFVNELMANNDSYFQNEFGEYEDWIELYNENDFEVDIGGMFLTDSLGHKTMSRIPTTEPDATTISPNGYLIIWADKEEEKGALHLNFKLSALGEEVGLIGSDGITILDTISFGSQTKNVSYGRLDEGWVKMNFPTPYEKNVYSMTSAALTSTSIVRVYPNPFRDFVTIDFSSMSPQPFLIYIMDPTGKILDQFKIKESELKNRYSQWNGINTRGVIHKSGLYIYQIISEKEVLSGKFLLDR